MGAAFRQSHQRSRAYRNGREQGARGRAGRACAAKAADVLTGFKADPAAEERAA